MKYIYLGVLALVLICFAGPGTVMAEDSSDDDAVIYSGQIEVGARMVDDDGNSAKFEEYRDMGDGLYSDAQVQANHKNTYLKLDADHIGRDDQRYDLEGGKYGKFKFSVFFDETPHNYTRGAKSYFNGVGSADLTDSGNGADPSLWQPFDYEKQRKNVSFKGEYDFKTPFYVEFGGNRQDSEGIYPLGGRSGNELPAPIDWKEQNWFVGGGYQSRSVVASIRADISDFDNANNALDWNGQTGSLAPDSDFYKFSGRLVYRNPFLSSQASLSASHSKKENTTDMSLMDSGTSGMYHGEVSSTRMDGAWDFTPASCLDMKVYAKYADTEDESDILTVNSVTTVPYDHEKKQMGLETTFRMPKENFLDAGYQYTDAERSSRTDNDSTEDNLAFLQYRNRFYEKVSFRARYEVLKREGSFNGTDGYYYNDGTSSYITTSSADDGTRRYDVADQIRNRLSIETEITITEQLYGAFELAWWDRDYDDTVYGLTGTQHHEAYLSAGIGGSSPFSATIYLGWEYDENDMATDRDWSQTEEFNTFAYGATFEYPLMEERLRLILSWDHSIVDGETDFSPASGGYSDLTNVDDCTIQRLEARSVYRLNQKWDLKLGYIFERFDLDDGQYDGYSYLPSGATLTGAYDETDYDTHVVSLGAVYRF